MQHISTGVRTLDPTDKCGALLSIRPPVRVKLTSFPFTVVLRLVYFPATSCHHSGLYRVSLQTQTRKMAAPMSKVQVRLTNKIKRWIPTVLSQNDLSEDVRKQLNLYYTGSQNGDNPKFKHIPFSLVKTLHECLKKEQGLWKLSKSEFFY